MFGQHGTFCGAHTMGSLYSVCRIILIIISAVVIREKLNMSKNRIAVYIRNKIKKCGGRKKLIIYYKKRYFSNFYVGQNKEQK